MKPLTAFSPDAPPRWLLAFDFDGTLVDPDASEPTDPLFFELLHALRSSHQAAWGINTGRSLMHTVEGLIHARFPCLPDFLIVREREIYTANEFGRWIPDDSWNKPCDKAHTKLFRKHRRLLRKIRKWVESETAAVWGIQQGEPDGIVASTASEMDAILAHIDSKIGDIPALSYQRNGVYLRFSHADYHKGTAMREVARQQGITQDRTFAIGDSHNDLDMLDRSMAAHIACPANACPEIRQHVTTHGGYVAKLPASQGVIEALQTLFQQQVGTSE